MKRKIRAKGKHVFNVAVNDYDGVIKINGVHIPSYTSWIAMLNRCYGKQQKRDISYVGCSVCEDWLHFSTFKEWYDKHHVDGYVLDKDLICRGNRVYSPQNCCFVPPEINTLLLNCKRNRGLYPVGVTLKDGKYRARLRMYGKDVTLGRYDSIEEAFNVYKIHKESYIKEVATKYYEHGEITKRVYDALIKYEVSIED